MDPIRIVLVDDQDLVRHSLRRVIAAVLTMEVVGEADNGADAVAVAARAQPDVILLDLDLGGQNGLDLLPELRSACPTVRVLVLTGLRDLALHQRVVMSGAMGLVLKSRAVPTLIRAIEVVNSGEVWFDPSLPVDALRELARGGQPSAESADARVALLSAREREVVQCVTSGMRTRDIAQRLAVSEATVRSHLTSIFSKLGVTDRTELVIFAHRRPDLNGQ